MASVDALMALDRVLEVSTLHQANGSQQSAPYGRRGARTSVRASPVLSGRVSIAQASPQCQV